MSHDPRRFFTWLACGRGVAVAVGVGLENHRTEHGRQRQGHQAGENDGRGHRDAELAVEDADRPGNERHRNEDGRHHQRDGDDRAGDLVKHLHGRPVGRKVLRGHLGMHRLDHHDRIVHHDADRQHHREERDQVDRETEQLAGRKRSRSATPAPPGSGSAWIVNPRGTCRPPATPG